MRVRLARTTLAAAAIGGGATLAVALPSGSAYAASYAQSYTASCPSADVVTPAFNQNLIENPDAAATTTMPGAVNGAAYPDCWTVDSTDATAGSTLSADPYASYGSYETGIGQTGYSSTPGGPNFFLGGYNTDATGVYTYGFQTISLATLAPSGQPFSLSAYLGGQAAQPDFAEVIVTFENASGAALSQAQVGPDTAAERSNLTEMIFQSTTGTVPQGTTQAVVEIETEQAASGSNDDGSAADLDLSITGGPTSALPESPSTILLPTVGVAVLLGGTTYTMRRRRRTGRTV
jgi:hypothetical protein